MAGLRRFGDFFLLQPVRNVCSSYSLRQTVCQSALKLVCVGEMLLNVLLMCRTIEPAMPAQLSWHVQEPKCLVALSLNLISVQPCAGRENKKWERVEIIIFGELKVSGNMLYTVITNILFVSTLQNVDFAHLPTIANNCQQYKHARSSLLAMGKFYNGT